MEYLGDAMLDTVIKNGVPTLANTGAVSGVTYDTDLNRLEYSLEVARLGTSTDNDFWNNPPKSFYTADDARLDTLKNFAILPRSELDILWVQGTAHHRSPDPDQIWWYAKTLRALTKPKANYYYTLQQVIDDPVMYIKLMGLYKGAGIALKRIAPGYWFNASNPAKSVDYEYAIQKGDTVQTYFDNRFYPPSNTQNFIPPFAWSELRGDAFKWKTFAFPVATFNTPLLTVETDRFSYATLCKQFYEVCILKYIQRAYNILDFSKVQDLATLKTVYTGLINRWSSDIIPILASKQSIMVQYKGVTIRTWESFIPDDFINGPEVHYAEAVSYPEFSKVLPARSFPAGPHTARAALEREYRRAIFIVLQNINKVEARLTQLSDTTRSLEPTAIELDPYTNPFLVYSQAASQKAGAATFINTAVNNNQPGKMPAQVSDTTGPTSQDYQTGMANRNNYVRQFTFDDGLLASQNDLDAMGKKTNWLLWAALGAGAAYLTYKGMS